MTNLEALRYLTAENMAEFLTDHRLLPLLAVLGTLDQPAEVIKGIEGSRDKMRAAFLNWLLAEFKA